ncbi:hypothetical protein ACM66B_004536 [Microbotryomycetes sp. NB124-2]
MTSFVEADILPASLQQTQDEYQEDHSPSAFGTASAYAANLPALPKASLSPATERYAWRQGSSNSTSPQTAPPSASVLSGPVAGSQSSVNAGNVTSPSRQQLGSGRGLDLSKPVQPHKTMAAVSDEQPTRLGVKDRVAQMNANSDPRDTASARENILALAGQGNHSSNGGPISLAAFMGGASKAPRMHRINMGPTEAEQEETDRIEREMAAARARWANKSGNDEQPAPGARSLASLVKGTVDGQEAVGERSAIADRVAQRYQPAKPDGLASPTASSEPRSMASAFGSAASGPRLNSQRQHHDSDSGPMHARPASRDVGFGLPGLVASRATQKNDSDASAAPSAGPTSAPSSNFVESPTEDKPKTESSRWSNPAGPSHGRSWSSTAALVTSDKAPEPRYSRGPALPGMSVQSKPAPTSSGTFPPAGVSSASLPSSTSTPKSPQMQKADSESRPSSPVSVRDAAKLWGQAKSTSKPVDAALKASYGVKVSLNESAPAPAPATKPHQTSPAFSFSAPSRPAPEAAPVAGAKPSSHVADATSANAVRLESNGSTTTFRTPAPASPPSSAISAQIDKPAELIGPHRAVVDEAVQLCLTPKQPSPLPGESIHFDVYSLVTNESEPIAHNHCLFQTEILAVVNKSLVVQGGGSSSETKQMFVWYGRDSFAGSATKVESKIASIAKANSIAMDEVVTIRHGGETLAFGQVFGDQVTILDGLRDDFDHLETRLYTVQARQGVVFVEERDLSSRNLCSGFCAVFSIVGEVYAWYGAGSSDAERQAALEFAESIADGRQVSELKEGSEVAYFWHGLDGLEYANAPYWKHRAWTSLEPLLLEFDQAKTIGKDDFDVSLSVVSLIDGGIGDHWVLVPDEAKQKKVEIALALEAAEQLTDKWRERGLMQKNVIKVLQLPSLVPRDLTHYARGLRIAQSNETPRQVRMIDFARAKEELL